MYKGKLSVWGSIIGGCLLFCFIFNTFIPFLGGVFEKNEGTIFVENSWDSSFIDYVRNKSFCKTDWYVTKDSPDIFISDNNVSKQGYQLHENYIYTPLVLYVRNAVMNNEAGFISLNPQDNSPAYQIDLYAILNGMLEDKNWKDIGISTKVIKDKINIVIPDIRSPWYNEVVELFYLTLNNGKEPTSIERENLKPKVDELLAKCEKIIDISQGIDDEYHAHSTNYKVFIGPEYLYVRGGSECSRNNTDAFIPVYFLNTRIVYLNLYQRIYNNERDVFLTDLVNSELKNTSGFFQKTGYRISDSFVNLRNLSSSYANVIPGMT